MILNSSTLMVPSMLMCFPISLSMHISATFVFPAPYDMSRTNPVSLTITSPGWGRSYSTQLRHIALTEVTTSSPAIAGDPSARLLTVGAQSSRFSSDSKAARYSLLWMRFSVLNPSNPAWAYLGSFSTETNC